MRWDTTQTTTDIEDNPLELAGAGLDELQKCKPAITLGVLDSP
jgi:hypothetical protein